MHCAETTYQSEAPGSVNGRSDFSLQHTFVDNSYSFCRTVLIYWICCFLYYFISTGVESGDQFLLKYLKFSPVFLVSSSVQDRFPVIKIGTHFDYLRHLPTDSIM